MDLIEPFLIFARRWSMGLKKDRQVKVELGKSREESARGKRVESENEHELDLQLLPRLSFEPVI